MEMPLQPMPKPLLQSNTPSRKCNSQIRLLRLIHTDTKQENNKPFSYFFYSLNLIYLKPNGFFQLSMRIASNLFFTNEKAKNFTISEYSSILVFKVSAIHAFQFTLAPIHSRICLLSRFRNATSFRAAQCMSFPGHLRIRHC